MGLSKEKRTAARESAEASKASAVASRETARKRAEERDRAVREALARKREAAKTVVPKGEVGLVVEDRATRLLEDASYRGALEQIEKVRSLWLRPVGDWKPLGKGRTTLYRRLCEHLFARYSMPAFLWEVFPYMVRFGTEVQNVYLAEVVARVARGESLYEQVKAGRFPIPLTRKMCHDALQSPSGAGFVATFRRAQVRAVGGGFGLWKAWCGARRSQTILMPDEEAFWAVALQWFANQPMLDPAQVDPLCDYIAFRRREDINFSLKGRSANAMIEAMREWHTETYQTKQIGVERAANYLPSGFKNHTETKSRMVKGEPEDEIWRIRELLTAKDLLREGQGQKHCVFSYAARIEKGDVSIWSMTREDERKQNWHALTIEVVNATRSIVQARGQFNRLPFPEEETVLDTWAGRNSMTRSGNRMW